MRDPVDWQHLGRALGLYDRTLTKIRNDQHEKTDACKIEMLAAWLQQLDDVSQKGPPSWSVLQDALTMTREKELADKIFGGELS